MFYSKVIICQHFLQETYLLLVFVRLKTLVLFFLCFSPFCEFQCPFHKNTFALTYLMGMFYFILVWWGLKSIKLKKSLFFPPIFNKFAIQNNPLIQLYLMFHKTVNKNKLEVWKFQSHSLSSFWAIKKMVNWSGRGERVCSFCFYYYFCMYT